MNGIQEAPMCEDAHPASPIILTEKRCSKCGKHGKQKSLDCFYSDKYGRLWAKCKDCHKTQMQEWQKNNKEAKSRHYRKWYELHKEDAFLMHIEWRRKNPEKVSAYRKLFKAIKQGKVIKIPCEVCGEKQSEGHHNDYEQPLAVTWLCPQHHKDVHERRI